MAIKEKVRGKGKGRKVIGSRQRSIGSRQRSNISSQGRLKKKASVFGSQRVQVSIASRSPATPRSPGLRSPGLRSPGLKPKSLSKERQPIRATV